MNALPKIVFSRTLSKVEWNNTRLVKDHMEEEMRKMKQLPGRDMVLLGSGNILTQSAQHGLIDEYRIMVNPLVLGAGTSLFNGIKDRLGLKLLETRSFRNGNTELRYEPAGKEKNNMAATSTIDRPATKTVERELVITREFNAPREEVWKAWTDPELVKRWWGPKGFTAPVSTIDLRVGGTYLNCMRSPEGKDFWSTGVYREIVPLEKVVCSDSFADEKGNVVPASYYGMSGDFPLELQITVTFEDVGRRTGLTLRHAGIPADEMREMTKAGWNESFDKLAEILK
jgi:uncharacterized protein YndB with AHSA1/START domain